MGMTTTTVIPAVNQYFYDRILLERATPYLAHSMFGQKRPLPQNKGEGVTFRRYSSLTPATAPLVEGVTPSSQALAKTDITKAVKQYGTFVEITDLVQYTTEDPILTEKAEILGENAGESLDMVFRDGLIGGSSVYRAGNVAQASIVTLLTATELDKIIKALRLANAKYWIKNPIAGSTAVGTQPIGAAYFAICDPRVTYDLKTVLTTSFIETKNYPNQAAILPGEVGSYKSIRFIETTNAYTVPDGGGLLSSLTTGHSTSGTNLDVHYILIFGQNAYGISDMSGKGLENIVKPLGAGDDPLNQRSTSAWKATTCGTVILNDAFMYRYEVAVTN